MRQHGQDTQAAFLVKKHTYGPYGIYESYILCVHMAHGSQNDRTTQFLGDASLGNQNTKDVQVCYLPTNCSTRQVTTSVHLHMPFSNVVSTLDKSEDYRNVYTVTQYSMRIALGHLAPWPGCIILLVSCLREDCETKRFHTEIFCIPQNPCTNLAPCCVSRDSAA